MDVHGGLRTDLTDQLEDIAAAPVEVVPGKRRALVSRDGRRAEAPAVSGAAS